MARYAKFHGLGNDFLVALEADNPGLAADPTSARALCDRRRGVGADGLALALAPADGSDADARMVLLNADGSTAEISGNGIRCVAQALWRAGLRTRDQPLDIDTAGGRRTLHLLDGDPEHEALIEVDMGPVTPGPEPSAAARAYPASQVGTASIGNPHLVVVVEDPDAVDLTVDGPALAAGFPDGINVHFVGVQGTDRLELRPFERGAGATEACGSGASAAVALATAWGLVEGRVTVAMPGGEAVVELLDGSVHLCGPSTFVAEVVTP